MTTSKDIARMAGVSQTTVSRVLQNKPNVRESTRERVLAVLQGTGYVPNEQARAMRLRRTGTIGVVAGRITNPFYPELIDALGEAITRRGYRMVLWAQDSTSGESAAIEAIQGRLIDGVVFTSATEGSESLMSATRLGLPVVLVIRSIDDADCDMVTSDNRAGGRLAADHFAASGGGAIAVVGGGGTVSTGRERREGFLAGLAEHGITVPRENLYDTDFDHDAAKGVARTIFARKDRPRSIFCVNDVIAFGVLDAAHEAGLDVPGEVRVVGYDDVRMASWSMFDLTTLTQPVEQMAELGVDLLTKRLNEPDLPVEHRRFTPELRVRGSAPATGS